MTRLKRPVTRLLVCGGRDFTARYDLWERMTELDPQVVIHGAARGADTFAGEWARANGRTEISVPANWGQLGGYAGIVRNQRMLTFQPDGVLAAPGKDGTNNMILTARYRGFPVEQLYEITPTR